MKKIIKIFSALILTTSASQIFAQTIAICYGNSTVITAVNSSNLSNPSYSLNPGGITSNSPSFTVTPTSGVAFTLYVTGTNSNSALVTTSNTVGVQLSGSPTYSVISPQNFTLGCATKSVCTIDIINASATSSNQVPNGGPVSYTLLSPGNTNVAPTGTLSSISSYTVSTAGIYTVLVRDNNSFCTSSTTINVTANTSPPAISPVSISQNPVTCTTPTTLVHASSNALVQHSWYFPATPNLIKGDTITIATNSAAPNPSIAVTLTLEIEDVNNACMSSTIVSIYQNIYKPIASINGPTTTLCNNPFTLFNVSTSQIPNGTFPTTAAVVALLWEGPAPQPSLSMSTIYTSFGTGIYTLTAQDQNNGCIDTATINVTQIVPVAAFVHTVTGGSVTFNSTSTGTVSSTTYFWDFGDGTTSTLQNPVHTYSSSGAHLVKLKFINFTNCLDSISQAVTVSGIPCIANSGFSMVPTSTAQVWSVIPSAPWNVTAATWHWGDNSTSNTLYTSHQYSAAGMYTICLSVTVSCVSTSSTCTSYSVYRTTQEGLMVQVNVVSPDLISGLNAETNEQLLWEIIPNPNAGDFKLNLRNVGSETIHIMISDLTGRILQDRRIDITDDTINFHTEDLPSGMYLVTIDSGKLRQTKRMVVNR